MGILESIRESLPFFIPEGMAHEMLEGDFDRARQVFENARYVDYSQFPIGKDAKKRPGAIKNTVEEPHGGEASFGFNIDL